MRDRCIAKRRGWTTAIGTALDDGAVLDVRARRARSARRDEILLLDLRSVHVCCRVGLCVPCARLRAFWRVASTVTGALVELCWLACACFLYLLFSLGDTEQTPP